MKSANVTVEKLKVTKPEVKAETVEASPTQEIKAEAEAVEVTFMSKLTEYINTLIGKKAEDYKVPGVEEKAEEPEKDKEACPHCGGTGYMKAEDPEKDKEEKKAEEPKDPDNDGDKHEASPVIEKKAEAPAAPATIAVVNGEIVAVAAAPATEAPKAEEAPKQDLSVDAWRQNFGFVPHKEASSKKDWQTACTAVFDNNAFKKE